MAGGARLGPETGAGALYRVRRGGQGQQAASRRVPSVAGGGEPGAPRLLSDSHPKLITPCVALLHFGNVMPAARRSLVFQTDVDSGPGRNPNA